MGQRSQIFIRYNRSDGAYHGFIARYFQWNYAERMISRASGIILQLTRMMESDYYWQDISKLIGICDVNFDIRDISFSQDILMEIAEGYYDVKDLFAQDNNDGQLLIDVQDSIIKYAFIRYYTNPNPMTARKYMKWDAGAHWSTKNEFYSRQTINYTNKNIRFIQSNAQLMTQQEVKEFLASDYSEYVPMLKI